MKISYFELEIAPSFKGLSVIAGALFTEIMVLPGNDYVKKIILTLYYDSIKLNSSQSDKPPLEKF